MFKIKYRNKELVIFHTLNGKLHKEDGPAVEYSNGNLEWYKNGKRHREDGPAMETHEGDKYWFKNGQLHRLNGPAAEYFDNQKEWYIDDTEYTEEEYKNLVKTNYWRK